jgi:hypothetical protein
MDTTGRLCLGGTFGIASVWNAADAAANGMTLSNGGLTVTPNASAAYQSVRGTNSKTSGKFYVEFAMTGGTVPVAGGDPGIGLADAGFNPVGYISQTPYSMGMIIGVGNVTVGNPSGSFAALHSSIYYPVLNDVLAIAVDLTAGKIWLAVNNAWLSAGNPATGANPMATFTAPLLGATFFPAMTLRSGASLTGVWTLQAAAANQKYAAPSGFTAWDAP